MPFGTLNRSYRVALPNQRDLYDFGTFAAYFEKALSHLFQSGTYSGTPTGVDPVVARTIRWYRIGDLVHLSVGSYTGTSDATSFTITGAPEVIRPAVTSRAHLLSNATNNGSEEGPEVAPVSVVMNFEGTLVFARNNSNTGWTAGGDKGFANGFEYTYSLESA